MTLRILKRLAQRGARIRRHPDTGYGVYPKGDLRRRPLARMDEQTLQNLRGEGWIEACQSGGYQLNKDGFRALERLSGRATLAQAHQMRVEKPFMVATNTVEMRSINLAHSPLARWMKPDPDNGKAFLSAAEFEAGEALRSDYHVSTLGPRITSDWSRLAAPGRRGRGRRPEDAPLSALHAKERVFKALEAVGPGLDRVLTSVVLNESGMEQMEQRENWPRRSGKAVLKLALQRLAIHYGFLSRETVSLPR